MTKDLDTPIVGNLSFASHAPETEAERCLLILQAALNVAGKESSSRKVSRLKKAMQKNSGRRYSFELHPVAKATQELPSVLPDHLTDALGALLKKSLHAVKVQAPDVKKTSSGHILVKYLFVCPATTMSSDLRALLTSEVSKNQLPGLLSFSVHSVRSKAKGEWVGVAVQCSFKKDKS